VKTVTDVDEGLGGIVLGIGAVTVVVVELIDATIDVVAVAVPALGDTAPAGPRITTAAAQTTAAVAAHRIDIHFRLRGPLVLFLTSGTPTSYLDKISAAGFQARGARESFPERFHSSPDARRISTVSA
jgi:hypothetical protein